MGCFKLPTGEYRFFSSPIICPPQSIVYIDPSTWCIEGEYREKGRKIVTLTEVTARLIEITPFTIAWIADTHATEEKEERLLELSEKFEKLNPTLSIIIGDIVNGSGEYRGSEINDKWFENSWNIFKNVPNHLWVKGNHDVDPGHYEFYNWAEKLWSLNIGPYKLIAFDTFDEGRVIPHTSHTFISLSDTLWLRRRLSEDDRYKIILAHHLYSQWRIFAYLALKNAINLKHVFAGHDHKAYIEEVKNVKALVNGTAAPEVEEHYITLTTFFKNGEISATLVKDVEIESNGENYNIRVNHQPFYGKPLTFIRFSEKIGNKWVNIYVSIGDDGKAELKVGNGVIYSTNEYYVVGEDLHYDKKYVYDTWIGLNGRIWKAYKIPAGEEIRL